MPRKCKRGVINGSDSIDDTSDNEPISVIRSRVLLEQKYPVGTQVRKKFGNRCFNGKVISFNSRRELWLILYGDGDREEMDKNELIRHMGLYNRYNIKK